MVGQVRWGVLGTAGIARGQVIPAIQSSSNGHVAAVAGRDLAQTESFAKETGIPRALGGYQALLDDPEIDAIYIPLPNSIHGEWAIRAAEAGKPVLCEKPLAMDAAEAKRVVDVFAARKLPLMEGFMYRFHPQNVRVKALIATGAIGEVREVRAHLSVDLMSPADPKNVRFIPELGGGARLDMGCYSVSIVRGLVGRAAAPGAGWLDMAPRVGGEVAAAGLLGFSGGVVATATCSFRAGAQGAYTVVGTKGSIEVPRAIIPGMDTRVPEGLIVVMDADGHRTEETVPPARQYTLMAEAFAKAVIEGGAVPFPPVDAVQNMRVLDAIAASAQSGMRIKL